MPSLNAKIMSQNFYKQNVPNKYNLPLPMNLPITSSLSAELAKPFPRVAINSNQHINISKATSTTTTEILKHQAIYPKVNHIYNDQGK